MKNEVTFSANWDGTINENYAYINNDMDVISVFWLVFADSTFISSNVFENKTSNTINFYPNPSQGTFNISKPEQIINMQVFNIYGQQIQNFVREDKISLSEHPSGMYFVRMEMLNGEGGNKEAC